MPSDYLNYLDNLAFPPKSADDLNEQKRQSDVLISAIEKCEKLEKENQQLKELLRESAAYVKSVVMVANDCKEYEVANKHNKLFIDICEAIGEKK